MRTSDKGYIVCELCGRQEGTLVALEIEGKGKCYIHLPCLKISLVSGELNSKEA